MRIGLNARFASTSRAGSLIPCAAVMAACLACVALMVPAGCRAQQADWAKPVEPFRIAGNLYYVGARDLTAFLITTDEGHFLLDGGVPEMAPQVAQSIEKLGFRLRDVKLLLNSHSHFDHAGGLAELQRLTGARLAASEGDTHQLKRGGVADFAFGDRFSFPAPRVDRTFNDGASFTLGSTTLHAMVTPGHTRGCTTWKTEIREGERRYQAVFVCSVTAPGYRLVNNPAWPDIREAFEETFRRLRAEPCDIFLGAHGNFFDLLEKIERRGRQPNPFVDPQGYRRLLDQWEKRFREQVARQRRE